VISNGVFLFILLILESVANQHEAMSRAIMLADRNKQLQKELHDIDQMALAVEAECNSTVKENSVRVSKIQVRKNYLGRE
jgi:centrosomal protein CEP135